MNLDHFGDDGFLVGSELGGNWTEGVRVRLLLHLARRVMPVLTDAVGRLGFGDDETTGRPVRRPADGGGW